MPPEIPGPQTGKKRPVGTLHGSASKSNRRQSDEVPLNLDYHFHYFGAESYPFLFVAGSVFGSGLGGILIGALLFTDKGYRMLSRVGI